MPTLLNLFKLYLILIFSILISSCSSLNSNSNNQASCPNVKQYSNHILCSQFWYDSDKSCNSIILNELISRRVDTSKNRCGAPLSTTLTTPANKPLSCPIYEKFDSESICKSYWNNTNSACDYDMRQELNKRKLHIDRQRCGTPICQSVSSMSETSLCSAYWSNSLSQCNAEITNELNKRNLRVSPREMCGSCSDYKSMSTENICSSYWNNRQSSCANNMRLELEVRGLQSAPQNFCGKPWSNINSKEPSKTPKVEVNKEPVSIEQCKDLSVKFKAMTNPIKVACELNYNSKSKDVVLCKKEIAAFINANSKGVGSDITNCGLK